MCQALDHGCALDARNITGRNTVLRTDGVAAWGLNVARVRDSQCDFHAPLESLRMNELMYEYGNIRRNLSAIHGFITWFYARCGTVGSRYGLIGEH